jgi:hypothetical protein
MNRARNASPETSARQHSTNRAAARFSTRAQIKESSDQICSSHDRGASNSPRAPNLVISMNEAAKTASLAIALLVGANPASTLPAASQCRPPDPQAAAVTCTCRMGPVSFEAPTCNLRTRDSEDGHEDHVDWTVADSSFQVVLITPKRPRSFKGYLPRWSHNHKCTIEELHEVAPTPFRAPSGVDAKDSPPQVTWSGRGAAPEVYVIRAIAVGSQVVELHVLRNLFQAGPPLDQILTNWLDRVQISPGARSGR